jgi:hypothetical protein
MSELIFAAALLTIAIGSLTLWINPQRAVNRVFALFSYTVSAWIFVCSWRFTRVASF